MSDPGMVLVCGEALMDVFALGDTPTGTMLEARIGGSPFNVAIGLARLDRPVAFLGSISTGVFGERLLRALREEGVDTTTVERVAARTTLGLVGVDAGGVPDYAFYGEGGADRQLSVESLTRLAGSPSAIHIGSFATVVEPIASTLRALVGREHRRVPISYDPNVRLNVEADLGRWRETLGWMLARTHVLKISAEDLELLRPGVAADAFVDEALAAGVRLAVVTRGSGGALAATASTRVEVPAILVRVVDTVGAGDSFQAALLARLDEQGALTIAALAGLGAGLLGEAVRFACTAAAITCTRRGADLARRDEVASAMLAAGASAKA